MPFCKTHVRSTPEEGAHPGLGGDFSHRLLLSYIGERNIVAFSNVTDETPSFFVNADKANTDVSTYRLYGTTFWLRLDLNL